MTAARLPQASNDAIGASYRQQAELTVGGGAQVGLRPTGRRCTQAGCSGRLRDNILDWEQALPEDELAASEEHASKADLAICLGTSLQITPACDIPLRTKQAGMAPNPPSKHSLLTRQA